MSCVFMHARASDRSVGEWVGGPLLTCLGPWVGGVRVGIQVERSQEKKACAFDTRCRIRTFLRKKIKIWFDDVMNVKSCGQEWSSFQPLALHFFG